VRGRESRLQPDETKFKYSVMLIIYTNIIPVQKLVAINLFGVLLAPKGRKINRRTITHEAIHTAQMKEMLFVFFYLWYVVEWIIRLFGKGNAYQSISLEREAYQNDHDRNYLKHRKHYCWLNLL
jgi:hypothetical protein